MRRQSRHSASDLTQLTAQIVQSYGRHFIVETPTGLLTCTTRGKKTEYACGDWVNIGVINKDQGVIEDMQPRTSLLYRQDLFRSKLIAANVTQVLFVLAPWPAFSEELLNRCLIACEAGKVDLRIVLNKIDLPEVARARQRLLPYVELGYDVIELSALADAQALSPYLQGNTSVLVGQSGMGKSTLINALLPDARARVGAVSEALEAGTHTTTHAALYHLNETSHLIDVPGFQEFGLHHIKRSELAWLFRDFRPLLDSCRFGNCRHIKEPGCAVIAAVEAGKIHKQRFQHYQRWMNELKDT